MRHACPFSNNPRLVGDPVDTLTGACVERQRDFRLAGPLPLQWWRHYDSALADRKFSLGWGHAHDFDDCLRFDQDGIRHESPLGLATYFPPLAAHGQRISTHGKTLQRVNATHFILSEANAPSREFIFNDPALRAPLVALHQDKHRIAFQYDAERRLRAIVDSLGNALEVDVRQDGLIQEIAISKSGAQARRDLLTYQYDALGNLIAIIDGFGSRSAMAYDRNHRLVRKTDRIGHSFEYVYDHRGRCIHTRGADGVLDHQIQYVQPGELTRVTRSNGGSWDYRYQLDRLVSITDPAGGQQQFAYGDQGQLVAEIDPNGNETKTVFDRAGAVIGKLDPLGHFRSVPENLSAPDPLSHRVARNAAEFEYGRLVPIEENDVPGATVEPQSDESNRPPDSTLEKANLFSSANLGFVVGRSWWPEPQSGRRFDITGDLIHQRDPQGRMRRWRYDGNGNITKYVDFDGGVWTYEYGSWNHLLRETNPLGLSHRMEYDAQENLTLFEDAGGTQSQYAYDLKDQLVEVRRHGQVRERYQRDKAGNYVGKLASDGRVLVQVEIGAGNQIVKRSLSSGDTQAYAYDATGRYVKADTERDAIEFAYDDLGNRSTEKRNGVGVSHRYRGWRQFGESVWLDKFIIRQEIANDQSLIITDPAGGKHRVVRSAEGVLERRFSNGTVERSKYDHLGRCESKSVVRWSAPMWQRKYQWSGEGELRQVDDTRAGLTTFQYDAAHRLEQRTQSNSQADQYEFDRAGNLIAQPGLSGVVMQMGNRLARAGNETFHYNERNHIEERTSSVRGTTRYGYDSRDQLVRVDSPKGVWEAQYDAMGRRVRKIFNGQRTEYLWNTDQLAGEIFPDGQLRLYIYADPLALTPMLFMQYDSVDADPATGRRYIVLSDQIGTPVCVEDSAGEVVWQAKIEPLGEAVLARENRIEFSLRFPGHVWDADVELNYNRFRFYDPRLGRYLQSDPLGVAGGANVYAYPTNPLGNVDVRGLICATCQAANIPESECPPEHETPPKPLTAVDEIKSVGSMAGKSNADIATQLNAAGYSSVTGHNGGTIWTKALPDGNTAVVRVDPAMVRARPRGFADEVPHVHKEIVPTANVTAGNFHPSAATKLDDTGIPSSDPGKTHIPGGH